jgi:ABC-type transporter Mla maintaining outer membrane lipid asymmetry ATPase subunit MlaF
MPASTTTAPAADLLLQVDDLHKSFGAHEVLKGISLEVARGSVSTVLGPSGAGKSVLLKCLADVEQPESGRLRFDGRPLDFRDGPARAGIALHGGVPAGGRIGGSASQRIGKAGVGGNAIAS